VVGLSAEEGGGPDVLGNVVTSAFTSSTVRTLGGAN
jgi:hypothetical protein